MTYDSPKQIRRRQLRAESKALQQRRARRSSIAIPTDDEWNQHCDGHIARMFEKIDEGHLDAALRHVGHLITAAIQRRAKQIMRDKGILAFWTAMEMAEIELLGKEPI